MILNKTGEPPIAAKLRIVPLITARLCSLPRAMPFPPAPSRSPLSRRALLWALVLALALVPALVGMRRKQARKG